MAAVLLDERHGSRAARKRLDAELSRPREEVEHTRALHLELDDAEHCLLDLIGGGAYLAALQRIQFTPAGDSCATSAHVADSLYGFAGGRRNGFLRTDCIRRRCRSAYCSRVDAHL